MKETQARDRRLLQHAKDSQLLRCSPIGGRRLDMASLNALATRDGDKYLGGRALMEKDTYNASV